ncbi:membrane hypothetical protein [Candidatus Sulfotelmatobacter sp. SbA7]|nr:membrane hypothetical protein [Candidatus Sulfotelmatobacter sp. SbA7]
MNAKVQTALWLSHPALELLLAGAMLWRNLHRKFPVFFTYIIFQIVNFAVLFPIQRYCNYDVYFYGYWIGAIISLAIGFKVIHEIFLDVFRPYHTLRDLGTVLFKWAALVMFFVALVVAAASPAGQSPIVQAVVTVQRCVRVIQCGLILFLLVFSKYLGVSWRQQSFGIALGFGGFASVELAGNALYSGGQINSSTTAFLNTAAYCCAIVAWLGYALFKSASRESATNLLMSQRWEQSLGDLQRPATGDSLIPMFEGMVDRAFSRTEGDRPPVSAKELLSELSSAHKTPSSIPPPDLPPRK